MENINHRTVQCDSVTVNYWFDDKTKKYHVQDDICSQVTDKRYYDAWPDEMATGQYAVASLKSSGQFKPCAPGVGDGCQDFFFCCNPKGWQWEVWHYKKLFFTTDQVADSSSLEIEVLEPEKKPVYTITIIADGEIFKERVSALPPYLIDRKGNLLKKFWHRSCDAGYAEIASKHLSNIAVDSGLVIKLMAENLEVSQACICGDPPPFIVDRGGVYKRDRLKLGLAVHYAQVVSEYLSNIVVVSL